MGTYPLVTAAAGLPVHDRAHCFKGIGLQIKYYYLHYHYYYSMGQLRIISTCTSGYNRAYAYMHASQAPCTREHTHTNTRGQTRTYAQTPPCRSTYAELNTYRWDTSATTHANSALIPTTTTIRRVPAGPLAINRRTSTSPTTLQRQSARKQPP